MNIYIYIVYTVHIYIYRDSCIIYKIINIHLIHLEGKTGRCLLHNGASVSSMMMRQNPNEFNIVMANLGAGRAAGGWKLLEGGHMGGLNWTEMVMKFQRFYKF